MSDHDERYKQLTAKHPGYVKSIEEWLLFRDTVTGGGGYENGDYLTLHPKEKDDKTYNKKYTERKKYSVYLNLVRQILIRIVGTTFATPPIRTGDPKFIEWLKDCGGYSGGTPVDIDSVMKEIEMSSLTFANTFTVLDTPPGSPDEEESQHFSLKDFPPYLTNYSPINLWDWSYSDDGRIQQAKIVIAEILSDVESGNHNNLETFYFWTSVEAWVEESFKRDNERVVMTTIEKYPHGYNEGPPIIVTDFAFGIGKTDSVPFLKSIAPLAKEIYNLSSEQRAYYRNHFTFPMMTYQTRNKDLAEAMLTGGSDDVVLYDDGTDRPELIKGDVSVLPEYRADIAAKIQQMHIAATTRLYGPSTEGRSGESFRQEAKDAIGELTNIAIELEKTEKGIANLWSEVTGIDADYKVEYSRAFDLEDLYLALEDLVELSNMIISPTTDSAIKKRIAKRVTHNQDEYTKAADEIDKLEGDFKMSGEKVEDDIDEDE